MSNNRIIAVLLTVAALATTACDGKKEKEEGRPGAPSQPTEESRPRAPFGPMKRDPKVITATITYDKASGICTQTVGDTETSLPDLSAVNMDMITWKAAIKDGGVVGQPTHFEIEFPPTYGTGLGTPFRTADGSPLYFISDATKFPLIPVDTSTGDFHFIFVEMIDAGKTRYPCITHSPLPFGVHVQQ